MEQEKIHPQTIINAIMHYWGELQASLEQAQEGIQGNNFILVRDSAVMAKGYLDIISKYADKAIADICVVTEEAEYEVTETASEDVPQDENVEDVDVSDSQEEE